MRDVIEQFRAAIQSARITPPEIIPDGKLHRFATNGKRGDDGGWYVLHEDDIPAGAFGDWRTDPFEAWRADVGRTLSREEEAAHRARIEVIRRERDAGEAAEAWRRRLEAQSASTDA